MKLLTIIKCPVSQKFTHPVNMGILGSPYSCDFGGPVVIIGTPFCRRLAVRKGTDRQFSFNAVYNYFRYQQYPEGASISLGAYKRRSYYH